MKNIMTWLTVGVIVAGATTACSVTVSDADAGATGGCGGTGGATGGSGGTGGATGGSGGSGGTAGVDAGTGGTSGSGGTAGTGGDDGGGTIMCTKNPNTDTKCFQCGFDKCSTEHCACNANTACRTAMLPFYTCMAMPGADSVGCGTTFVTNANSDSGSATLANDLASCVVGDCEDTCQGRDASTFRRDREEIRRSILGRTNQ
jgi:hypothetical protein